MKPLQTRAQNQEHFQLVSTLSEQLKSLQFQTELMNSLHQRRGVTAPDSSSPEDLNQILDIKLSTFLTAVDTSFSQRLAEVGHNSASTYERMRKRLDGIFTQFETRSRMMTNSEEIQGRRSPIRSSRMLTVIITFQNDDGESR